eukprot:1770335-Pyramimonas_sp.AAC.1
MCIRDSPPPAWGQPAPGLQRSSRPRQHAASHAAERKVRVDPGRHCLVAEAALLALQVVLGQ